MEIRASIETPLRLSYNHSLLIVTFYLILGLLGTYDQNTIIVPFKKFSAFPRHRRDRRGRYINSIKPRGFATADVTIADERNVRRAAHESYGLPGWR